MGVSELVYVCVCESECVCVGGGESLLPLNLRDEEIPLSSKLSLDRMRCESQNYRKFDLHVQDIVKTWQLYLHVCIYAINCHFKKCYKQNWCYLKTDFV